MLGLAINILPGVLDLTLQPCCFSWVPHPCYGSAVHHQSKRVRLLGLQGWALAAGRLMQSLKPEHLDGLRLAQRFPQLRSLDLSHCLHTVAFHTRSAFFCACR